jgi:hypothetical protein
MKNMDKNEIQENFQYITVKQVAADKCLGFSEAMIRYYLLHSRKSGLYKAVRKIGRKVLIRRDLLLKWIEEHSL